MIDVRFQGVVEHQYVVEIYDDKFANEWSQRLVHDSHECTRRVRESKWHDKPLK